MNDDEIPGSLVLKTGLSGIFDIISHISLPDIVKS